MEADSGDCSKVGTGHKGDIKGQTLSLGTDPYMKSNTPNRKSRAIVLAVLTCSALICAGVYAYRVRKANRIKAAHALFFSGKEQYQPFGAEDIQEFNPIAEGILKSSLTLYEGLPHQMWEADELKKELAAKTTIQINGFPFYAHPIEMAANDVEVLRSLSASPDSYWSYAGPYMCGGFHPDYCLTWKNQGARYHLQICFGCKEMALSGPKNKLTADIRDLETFKTILEKYRNQRPPKADP